MKAYTVNNHLVGVGNSQILGTDQGGGGGVEYEAGQYISIDENNVISVTGISAGDGTLSIVQNATGAPVEITYPTDVAPASAIYDIINDSVSGRAYASSTYTGVYNWYYGNVPAEFNGNTDVIMLTVNESITNIGSLYFYYANSDTGIGGPTLATSLSATNYVISPGTYTLSVQTNPAPSSGYGKYLEIMFGYKSAASSTAECAQRAEADMAKISQFAIGRPSPALGVNVDLNRYYLGGNIVNNKPTNSGLPAQVWLNPDTKKQEVYLPNSVPGSWNLYTNNFYNYNSTPTSITGGSVDNSIAYKYDSATDRYIYARMTCSIYDTTNNVKKSEFVTLEPVNGNFEKWTYDYSDYYNRHWTTETISPDMSEYISYSASGVYLPNSKFEIDTNGQAYKVISESSEVQHSVGYAWGAIWLSNNTDSYYPAGTYKFIVPDTAGSIKFSVSSHEQGLVLPVVNGTATWVLNEAFTGTSSDSCAAYANADGTGSMISLSSDNSSLWYISPEVKEEYLTSVPEGYVTDQELAEAVTAVTSIIPAAQVNSDWNANSGVAEILNKPAEIQLIAGTNVQVEVTGASAIISAQGGGAGYATETYVQNYVQNYSIPVQVVASSAAATGTNILYVVTGS